MNKARSNYLYELVGIIKEKRKQVKGRPNFKLIVEITNQPQISFLQVFQDKLKTQQIWKDIESNQFIDQRYLFKCQNYFGNYHLIDWQILTNHGSN